MSRHVVHHDATTAASAGAVAPWPDVARLWSQSKGDARVCVAVLDGPVDLSHPCFDGARLTRLETLVPGVAEKGLASRHGTHVASVIFGQHTSPVCGIAAACRGLIIPVFREAAHGAIMPCSQLDLARAITQAVAHGAHVINISGGQLDPSGQAQPVLARAVQLCADNGILLVASAGNEGCPCLHVPAALPSVLVVGAMDAQGEPLDLSNWGQAYQTRGILACGQDVLGAVPGGGTARLTGTSFATAVVSGVAAVLLSIQLRYTGKASVESVRRAILQSAVACEVPAVADCSRLLSGRLNILGALAHLMKGANRQMTEPNDQVEPARGHRADPYRENGVAEDPSTAEDRQQSSLEGRPRAVGVEPIETPARMPAAEPPRSEPAPKSDERASSTCTCSCQAGTARLIYALGQIDYDFATEANRDSYVQQGIANPENPDQLLAHLEQNPWAATGIIWTLVQETTPIYAIQPAGPFAAETYARLHSFLRDQLDEGVTQVSIPGVEAGKVALLNGQVVPVLAAELRGMYSWSTPALVKAVLGERPGENGRQRQYDQQAEAISNFLERVYYELGNLGVAPQERAINYAATNAYQVASVYQEAIEADLKLDKIDVQRSGVCRTGADCWDVKLTFFHPTQRQQRAREVYRFTVDVSELVPVTVGKVRHWSIY